MLMIDECGTVDGMGIGRGSSNTQRKPAPVPLCSRQIPHDLTYDRTCNIEVACTQPIATTVLETYFWLYGP
jgi:hypothetical protein